MKTKIVNNFLYHWGSYLLNLKKVEYIYIEGIDVFFHLATNKIQVRFDSNEEKEEFLDLLNKVIAKGDLL
jgi:hypothetical protein